MTSPNKSEKRSLRRAEAERDASPHKVDVQLDCDCGAMLVPEPFVGPGGMRIAYKCPTHGLIHVVNPFAGYR